MIDFYQRQLLPNKQPSSIHAANKNYS